jgi:hypothetical protein
MDTPMSRGYAWGLQTDYLTQKSIGSAGALRRLITTDENTIDYEPDTNNDEAWSHGQNQETDQWLERHRSAIQHTMPAFVTEMGRPLILNLGDYAVSTPAGGTLSKKHVFKPQNPQVSRQGKAVTYAETLGPGWNMLMPRCVGNGFSLSGAQSGVLMMDFGLQGAGKLDPASAATWAPTATPTVAEWTTRQKFFNTQIALVTTPSGVSAITYGCRYRTFRINYQQTLLSEAAYAPGCAEFLTPGDPTSGQIASSMEFDKQRLDFTLGLNFAAGTPEMAYVQQQKPIDILLTATGGLIEGTIYEKLSVIIPNAKYKSTKPVLRDGIYQMDISGSGLFDYTTSKLFQVELINTIASYSTGW